MGDQNRLERDFEALALLLADIEKEIEPEREDDRSKLRELYEHCLLELDSLRKAKE